MKKNSYVLNIDVEQVSKYGIDIPHYITLVGFYKSDFIDIVNPDHFDKLEQVGLISFEDELKIKSQLTDIGKELLNATIKGKINLKKKELIVSDDFVTTFRSLFKGLKPGSMGYAQGVKVKLDRFMKEHQTTEEEILTATRAYLNSLESYKYLQQADYFIYKKEGNGAEVSRLSAFIDEVRNNGGNDGESWTSKLS